ncbi:MAG: DUF2298 domain-containing protein [Anaerolineae bacterium]
MIRSATDATEGRRLRNARLWWDRTQEWLSTDAATRWLLIAILLVAAYLRLTHLIWDQGTHIHPDERFLTMVSDAMRLPASLGEFFDSTKSPMSPYNKGYNFFVYGTLPLFIVRVVAEIVNEFNQSAQLWVNEVGMPLHLVGYDGIHLVGRALSGIFDLGCVFLAFVIGRRLYGRKVGLLAAALYAFAVLPLQQSHFYTVDTFGSFFALLAFYFAVRVAQGGEHGRRDGGWESYVGLGASLGASLACRINLAPLAGIAVLAAGIRLWDDWHTMAGRPMQSGPADANGRRSLWLGALIQATLFRLLLMGLITIAVFRVAQPYAFGGTSLLDFSLAPKFRDNMAQISMLIRGDADYPPGHQWASRTPFVFPFVNMVVWGLGIPLGLAAWAGWALAAFQVVRGLTAVGDGEAGRRGDGENGGRGDEQVRRESGSVAGAAAHRVAAPPIPWRNHLLIVAWIGGMFLWQGLQYVQSMRYLLPIYPHLAIMAAWLLWRPVEVGGRRLGAGGWGLEIGGRKQLTLHLPPSTLRYSAWFLLVAVTVFTMLWGWGFLAIYRRPLSRITASRWIYANIPPGKVIANEHWDDGLPLRIDGKDPFGAFGYRGLSSSSDGNLQMYMEDTPEKRELLYRWLNEADYIVLSSNRLWGSIPRLPMRYPMTTLYYKLLFAGQLGFKQVAHFTSFPTIFGIQFNDTGAEEAFSVYDHPEVYIFEKTPAYSEALARSYFDPIDLEHVIQMWPKQVSAAPTALRFTPEEAQIQYAGGTWSEIFNEDGLLNRFPLLSVLGWLLLIELLGLMAFPIAFVLLHGLADRGYGVSKTLGILLLAWLSWLGPALRIAPYRRWWIALMLGVLIGLAAALAWRRRAALLAFVRERRSLLLTSEAIFLVMFLLFLLIRIGNPDLWHPARGGEKPMDFAYLNAVIRSTIFPPIDPWQAGGFMNYYYFGFVIVGTPVKLIGIVPWVAYNLIVPTLFALTGAGAFTVAFNLADGDRATEFPEEEGPYEGLRIGSLLAGLAGVFFVTIIGNFGTVKLLFDQFAARSTLEAPSTLGLARLMRALDGMMAWLAGEQPLDFPNDWWFWNPSRIIPDTINEMPFFTFTYADLHAHMIALPLTLLALAIAAAITRHRVLIPNTQCPIPHAQHPIPATEPSPWRIERHELLPLLLMGLVVGALRATNTWDFPTYLLVSLAAIGVLEAGRRTALPFPAGLDERLAFLLRAAVAVIWRMLILIAVSSATFYPYTRYYATAYAGLQLWREKTTTLADYVTVWGFFLALTIIYLVSEWVAQAHERRRPTWLDNLLPAVAAAAIVLMAGGWLFKLHVWIVAVPLMATAGILALGRDLPPARRLALLLLGLALAITMGVEVVRQKDDIGRMNTVFKFYMQAWVLFGVATAFGLASWAARAMTWRPDWRRLAWGVTGVLFAGVMLFPVTAAPAKIRDRFSAEASPRGLDGMAYMDRAKYFDNNRDLRLDQDKDAILWMLRNVQGSPVILEAQTPEYRWGSRFSIYTGLPTVQGWNWHQKQQRSVVPGPAIDRRVADVREIYDTLDLARAQKLLNYYGASYIIVGELERAYYNPAGLAKFETLAQQGYLKPVYTGGVVTIYRIVRPGAPVAGNAPAAGIGPRPVPTITPAVQPFTSPQK